MKKIIILSVSVLLASLQAANAQPVSDQTPLEKFNLSTASVDPVGDSIAIEKMRAKMAEIRKTRPTVGLVLSGGGAKGAAHVGVLQYFEEMGIPIDLIVGTSMGGLIGGLYALGHSSTDIDTLITTADWSIILSDKVNPRRMTYSRKMYRNRYALEVPFKYDSKDFNVIRENRSIKLGAGDAKLTSSLPSGYITGFNVNEIFTGMSVDYHGDIDFTELPIPFVCVASDLVSGKAKNWHSGSIVTAMRSTMSIPALFTPVRVDGMVLMDGGTRNNFPTDLARAMGADIVIGVELSDKSKTFEEVNNLGDVVMQSIDMLGGPAFEKNVGGTDVFIKPDLTGYNMLSFDTKSVNDIVIRGYEAAKSQASALAWVKSVTKDAKLKYNAPAAKDMNKDKVLICSITFEGVYDDESRFLSGKLPFGAGSYVGGTDLKDALSTVFATGAFKDVRYELLETPNGYELHFDCVKGPIHRFGLGGRLDTQEFANVYLNLGINTYKLTGSTFDFTLRLGRSYGAIAKYSLDIPKVPTVNVEASAYRPEFRFENTDLEGAMCAFWNFTGKVYISHLQATFFDWKLGARYDYAAATQAWFGSGDDRGKSLENYREGLGAVFAQGNAYTMDNRAFPSRGMEFDVGYRFGFAGHGAQYDGLVHMINFDLRKAFGLSPDVSLILTANAHLHLHHSDTGSLYTSNYVGGDMKGRYFEQQFPFLALVNPILMKDHLLAIQLEPQVRIWKKLYGSVQAGVLKDADDISEQFTTLHNVRYGGAACIGYDTFMGPFKLTAGWNSLKNSWAVYASLGFDF